MLKKRPEQRSSLSEVLRSTILFPYIRQLRKERDAELRARCCRLHDSPSAKPVLKTAHSAEEVLTGDRITLWNPLNDMDDLSEDAAVPWLQSSLSLDTDAATNPFEVCEEPPTSPTSSLRSSCISDLGEEIFSTVHIYLKTQREKNIDDDLVQAR